MRRSTRRARNVKPDLGRIKYESSDSELDSKEDVLDSKDFKVEELEVDSKNLKGDLKNVKADPDSNLSFADRVAKSRHDTGASVSDFDFNEGRVRFLTEAQEVAKDSTAILYWMQRDQRVFDNWSLLYAQKLAIKKKLPMIVVFCFHDRCDGPNATLRTFNFMVSGLEEVQSDCRSKNINFDVLKGLPGDVIPRYVVNQRIGAVVTDFYPIRESTAWVKAVKDKLPPDVPLAEVDAHNIVPAWILHEKQVYQARQLRTKFAEHFPEFLTNFPDVMYHPHSFLAKTEKVDWKYLMQDKKIDRSVDDVPGVHGGGKAALAALELFIKNSLKDYEDYKNDPARDVSPYLSHYFHFGHLSSQRAFFEVQKFVHNRRYEASVSGFYEEAVVRKEMSDNYCLYNDKYDCLEGAYEWAISSLDAHRRDKRDYLYSEEDIESATTHDDLFNAATKQLKTEGRMHRYMKMYWPKKILEWTPSPEKAIAISNRLLNKYAYDGRDPDSYLAVMWAIGGLHDRPWAGRRVIGKIRCMMLEGCEKKFDVAAYVDRYSGV
uniref:Deoxyribodipyrimidine photo-lyase n=1 Tax=Neoseiulus barkeri TaxID=573039 RepID=A0A2P1ANK4_9ACAR|nr:DNA photolyase [Neoseiulus barkeri]